jgi:hypothetical protein
MICSKLLHFTIVNNYGFGQKCREQVRHRKKLDSGHATSSSNNSVIRDRDTTASFQELVTNLGRLLKTRITRALFILVRYAI